MKSRKKTDSIYQQYFENGDKKYRVYYEMPRYACDNLNFIQFEEKDGNRWKVYSRDLEKLKTIFLREYKERIQWSMYRK